MFISYEGGIHKLKDNIDNYERMNYSRPYKILFGLTGGQEDSLNSWIKYDEFMGYVEARYDIFTKEEISKRREEIKTKYADELHKNNSAKKFNVYTCSKKY